jgi:hypothetical protein
VLAPGVTALRATADTPGVQINGQTSVNFTFNSNPEWQATGTNHFGVILKLGKFYDVDPGAAVQPCNITLLAHRRQPERARRQPARVPDHARTDRRRQLPALTWGGLAALDEASPSDRVRRDGSVSSGAYGTELSRQSYSRNRTGTVIERSAARSACASASRSA